MFWYWPLPWQTRWHCFKILKFKDWNLKIKFWGFAIFLVRTNQNKFSLTVINFLSSILWEMSRLMTKTICPVWSRVFAVRMKNPWVLSYPLNAQGMRLLKYFMLLCVYFKIVPRMYFQVYVWGRGLLSHIIPNSHKLSHLRGHEVYRLWDFLRKTAVNYTE